MVVGDTGRLRDAVEVTGVELELAGIEVIHVTTHIGLVEAVEKIEPGLVHRTIRRATTR